MKVNKVVERDGRWFVESEDGSKNLGKKEGHADKSSAEKRLREIEAFKHMKNVRVNIHTAINADKVAIERSVKDGEEYTTIKNHMWMVDEIVLNGGLYSKEHNEKGYKSMEGRLFPAGHPTVNGQYVTISNQDNPVSNEALAKHYIGASTRNIRKVSGAYFEDIEVNNRLAMANEDGKELLSWCEKVEQYQANGGEAPAGIHTSTGLLCNQVDEKGESRGKDYTWVAINQNYDHNALLVNQAGAGGDEISLNVNGEQVETLTVNLDELLDSDPILNKDEQGLFNRLVAKFANMLPNHVKSIVDNQTEVDPMKEKMIAALNAAGINTEGLGDDQLFDKHSQLLSTNAVKDIEAPKGLTIEDVNTAVTEALKANKLNEVKEAKSALVDKVIAANKKYTEDDKEMLMETPEQILNSFLPAPQAAPIGRPVGNASEGDTSIINDTMPE
tara:strand:+ start:1853 stop:3184 length:1332 start_codon:yes stop_codon:yes gene_type:complete